MAGKSVHGATSNGNMTPEYTAWRNMRRRCAAPKHPEFKRYGAKGVSVCSQWEDYAVFLIDVGPRPTGSHSLDRFPDCQGNYEPGNVRWATVSEQNRNKRTNAWITFQGVRRCIKDWAKTFGVPHTTFRKRLEKWGEARTFAASL